MSKRQFEANLSASSVSEMAKKIRKYALELEQKNKEFARRLADIGVPVVHANYIVPEADSKADASHSAFVEVTTNGLQATAVLKVRGDDILFIEFGAGVHYNTPAGTSPHPKGSEFGYTIGSYGQGKGRYQGWYYKNKAGEVEFTRGVVATMPVYKASVEIGRKVIEVAREVFGS